jgi:hypothetical protein
LKSGLGLILATSIPPAIVTASSLMKGVAADCNMWVCIDREGNLLTLHKTYIDAIDALIAVQERAWYSPVGGAPNDGWYMHSNLVWTGV